MGQDQDDTVLVPITTAQKKLFGSAFPGTVKNISVQAVDEESLALAEVEIKEILRERHNLGKTKDDDFTVRNFTQMLETAKQASNTMAILLGAIASVSLLVGGIGIMNIMLATVMERTREIGIRRAIGARKRDIMSQFVTEAVVISIAGGLIGVVLGVSLSLLVSVFTDVSTYIRLYSVIIAFAFSVVVGVVFGYLPAKNAANLKPVDSIRYE
jgi:putative ABC transport system permease protein